MNLWYNQPLDLRAPRGGELGLNGREYKGGEFLPFYVPRPEMPQIDEIDLPEFLDFVRNRQVDVLTEAVDPATLRAHQRIDIDIAVKMQPQVLAKPAVVSKDSYVLDGNHRWWAHVHQHLSPMNILRIGLPFAEAIALMFAFPKTYTLVPGDIRN
ncbi:MAG: hypothetical protein ACTHJR_06425 [Sphingomonas sp.]|uniref:hypothetical protein n=1 Tax=Sphingomonas sp. TaxID=28214 RepID=UPI003F818B5D